MKCRFCVLTTIPTVLMLGLAARAASDSKATQYASIIQQHLTNEGFEVNVFYLEDEKTLMLLSDEFKDAEAREAVAAKLREDRKLLCSIEIWYAKIGYHKGMLSGDVTKNLSLGCPAAKSANLKESEVKRKTFAANLVSDMAAINVHSSIGGISSTTLILESDDWTLAQAPAFGRMLLQSPAFSDLCRLGFARVQLRNKKQLLKTIPLACG